MSWIERVSRGFSDGRLEVIARAASLLTFVGLCAYYVYGPHLGFLGLVLVAQCVFYFATNAEQRRRWNGRRDVDRPAVRLPRAFARLVLVVALTLALAMGVVLGFASGTGDPADRAKMWIVLGTAVVAALIVRAVRRRLVGPEPRPAPADRDEPAAEESPELADAPDPVVPVAARDESPMSRLELGAIWLMVFGTFALFVAPDLIQKAVAIALVLAAFAAHVVFDNRRRRAFVPPPPPPDRTGDGLGVAEVATMFALFLGISAGHLLGYAWATGGVFRRWTLWLFAILAAVTLALLIAARWKRDPESGSATG